MTIDKIESLTVEEARELAQEIMEIKGYECIFVDFKDRFGYSVLVFKNGKHIHYANDYELHHEYMIEEQGKEALRQFYVDEMNSRLFTDAELLEDIKTYNEYKRKDYFLRNYWIMCYDRLSIFGIGEKAQQEFDNAKPNFPFYNPVSFCYVSDAEIVKIQNKFSEHLKTAYAKLKENNDTFREMISYELANHEACITCDYTDALQSLGFTWERLTDEQRLITLEELEKQCKWYEEEAV